MEMRREIYELMKDGKCHARAELVLELEGRDRFCLSSLNSTLQRMLERREIVRVTRGLYKVNAKMISADAEKYREVLWWIEDSLEGIKISRADMVLHSEVYKYIKAIKDIREIIEDTFRTDGEKE